MNATCDTATRSEANRLATRFMESDPSGLLPMLGIPAPSSVNHQDYSVGYFDDKSILIWARGEGFIVLDQDRTYYRDTVEHLARCLGLFSKTQRAGFLGGATKWINGICWSAEGDFIELA